MTSSNGSPFLSVILPVLNEAETVTRQLMALRVFRERGAELVLVDGGSSDGTPALAAPEVDQLIVSARGRGRQMNAGAATARGNAFLFLHADTCLPAAALTAVADALASGAPWGRFDVRIDGSLRGLGLVARMMNWRSRLTGIATGDQAIFVRREAFETVGGYPELPLMEDIALSKRLKRLARPACLRQRVVTSARRWQKHGVLRTILLMWCLRARYFLGADPQQLAILYGYAPRQR